MKTLAELRDYMQDVIASIQEDFTEPDDDWMQVACIDTEDAAIITPLPNELFANGMSKDVLARFLKIAMVSLGARRYAVLFNTHFKEDPSEEELAAARREEQRIQHMTGAREMLLLVVGDAEQEDVWTAEIQRDGINPPTLKEWEQPSAVLGGRFNGFNQLMGLPLAGKES